MAGLLILVVFILSVIIGLMAWSRDWFYCWLACTIPCRGSSRHFWNDGETDWSGWALNYDFDLLFVARHQFNSSDSAYAVFLVHGQKYHKLFSSEEYSAGSDEDQKGGLLGDPRAKRCYASLQGNHPVDHSWPWLFRWWLARHQESLARLCRTLSESPVAEHGCEYLIETVSGETYRIVAQNGWYALYDITGRWKGAGMAGGGGDAEVVALAKKVAAKCAVI